MESKIIYCLHCSIVLLYDAVLLYYSVLLYYCTTYLTPDPS